MRLRRRVTRAAGGDGAIRRPSRSGNTATQPQTDPAQLGWRASPRWATVKRGASTRAVKKDPEAKFKAAQAKAEKLGVHTLTEQDIAGLTPEQITQIRGY